MSASQKITRRAQWLSDKVFPDAPIDGKAIAAMATLNPARAMEIFKELEEKSAEVKNPSGYLHAAVKREGKAGPGRLGGGTGAGGGGGGIIGSGRPPPAARPTSGGRPAQGGRQASSGRQAQSIAKRATWLNANVFDASPIDEEAISAMVGLGVGRAMELFKEIEEKAGSIKNPSGYLKVAAKREGGTRLPPPPPPPNLGAPPARAAQRERGGSAGPRGASTIVGGRSPVGAPPPRAMMALPGPAPNKVRRKIDWLNDRMFGNNISEACAASLAALPNSDAMAILGELEQRAGEVKNPNGYLQAAVRRALGDPELEQHDHDKIRRRATWLNDKVFTSNPIDDDAIGAMMGMGLGRAMELFKEIEEKAAGLRNPSGYLKNAAKREGFAPPDAPPAAPKAGGRTKDRARKAPAPAEGGADMEQVQQQIDWLNENVFADNPINEEAVEMMRECTTERALELLSDVESKAAQVKTPTGYLITAVARDRGGKNRGNKRPRTS